MSAQQPRTVLVTGSTTGIGEAIAMAFARDGDRVVVNGRDEERTAAAAKRVSAETGNDLVLGVAADVGLASGAQKLAAAVPDVDVLVNNVGIFRAVPVFDVPDDEWLEYFEVNVLSGVRLARQYVPGMVERGWGRVIFISSDSSVFIPTEMVHYATTKTAQLAVSRGIAQTVAGTGVTVNTVLPGPTLTPGVRNFIQARSGEHVPFAEAEASFVRDELPTSLLGRLMTPDEIANMVHYIGSRASAATSGAALRADGGVAPTIIP